MLNPSEKSSLKVCVSEALFFKLAPPVLLALPGCTRLNTNIICHMFKILSPSHEMFVCFLLFLETYFVSICASRSQISVCFSSCFIQPTLPRNTATRHIPLLSEKAWYFLHWENFTSPRDQEPPASEEATLLPLQHSLLAEQSRTQRNTQKLAANLNKQTKQMPSATVWRAYSLPALIQDSQNPFNLKALKEFFIMSCYISVFFVGKKKQKQTQLIESVSIYFHIFKGLCCFPLRRLCTGTEPPTQLQKLRSQRGPKLMLSVFITCPE